MSEMIERVAKVLAHIERVEVDDEHLMMARAAIEAMREPTGAMVEALDELAVEWQPTATPTSAYQASIDEALK